MASNPAYQQHGPSLYNGLVASGNPLFARASNKLSEITELPNEEEDEDAPPKPPKPLYPSWKLGKNELPNFPQDPDEIERRQSARLVQRQLEQEAAAVAALGNLGPGAVALLTDMEGDGSEYTIPSSPIQTERRRSSLLEFLSEQVSRRSSSGSAFMQRLSLPPMPRFSGLAPRRSFSSSTSSTSAPPPPASPPAKV